MPSYVSRVQFSLYRKIVKEGDEWCFGTHQIYTCVGITQTRSGADLIRWKSHCKVCGGEFFCETGYVTNGPIRNCKRHRARRYGASAKVEPMASPVEKEIERTTTEEETIPWEEYCRRHNISPAEKAKLEAMMDAAEAEENESMVKPYDFFSELEY